MKKAAVLFAQGFEEVEALTPVDFLRRAGVDVTVTGVGDLRIIGGHSVSIEMDATIEQLASRDFDAVVIPGGMPGAENIAASAAARTFIKGIYEKGGLVAAICAAPAVVLDPMGILKNRKATCYPGFESRFKDAGFTEERVVLDGTVLTSRGPGSAAEFSLAVIRYLVGDKAAEDLRKGTLQPV